jgi:hypothetical protein
MACSPELALPGGSGHGSSPRWFQNGEGGAGFLTSTLNGNERRWNELRWSGGWGTLDVSFGAKRNRWRDGVLMAPFIGATMRGGSWLGTLTVPTVSGFSWHEFNVSVMGGKAMR